MWKDIHSHWAEFLSSPIFRHIALQSGESFIEPAPLDNSDIRDIDVSEETLALPIPADRAQLKASTCFVFVFLQITVQFVDGGEYFIQFPAVFTLYLVYSTRSLQESKMHSATTIPMNYEIGRASCRERV